MPKDSYAPVILALTLTAIFTGLVLHLVVACDRGRTGQRARYHRLAVARCALGETAEPANG
jgi:hypothetical protein